MNPSIVEYKEFIDSIVNLRPSIIAHQVRTGIWNLESKPEDVPFNQLLASLSIQQRELISEMIQHAVDAAIEDILIFMTDRGYLLNRLGIDLAVEPFDSKTYFDFASRCAGKAWPDDCTTQPPPAPTPLRISSQGMSNLGRLAK